MNDSYFKIASTYASIGSGNRVRLLRKLDIPAEDFVNLRPHQHTKKFAKFIIANNMTEQFDAAIGEL